MAKPNRGATSRRASPRKPSPAGKKNQNVSAPRTPGFSIRVRQYFIEHARVAKDSMSRLVRAPAPTLMTVMVIAIALAFPTGLLVALNNAQALGADWQGSDQISLFLKRQMPLEKQQAFAEELQRDASIERTEWISPADALQELQEFAGFEQVVANLDENPLPGVVVVYPKVSDVLDLEVLELRLGAMQQVDSTVLDMQWVRKLQGLLSVSVRVVLALAFGLALAVVLIVVNTIRLHIESRKDEVVIIKLVGGTDSFVRRPFLYTGLWYGLIAGVVALCMVLVVLGWLRGPIQDLALIYGSDFELIGLTAEYSMNLVLISMLLGWLGAWAAVARHLRAMEP